MSRQPLMSPLTPESPSPDPPSAARQSASGPDPSSSSPSSAFLFSHPKRSSLGRRDQSRAPSSSSVRFERELQRSPSSSASQASPSESAGGSAYGSSDESLPLFYSVHTARKSGRAWLKRTKALSLSSLNLGDGSTSDTEHSPLSEGAGGTGSGREEKAAGARPQARARPRKGEAEEERKQLQLQQGQYAVRIKTGDEDEELEDEEALSLDTPSSLSSSAAADASASSSSTSSSPAQRHRGLSSLLATPVASGPPTPSSAASSSFPLSLLSSSPLRYLSSLLQHHDVITPLTDPVGEYRRFWLLLIFLFILYEAISVPLRLAFIRIWDDRAAVAVLSGLDYLGDLFFLLDVVLYFFTPYLSDGILERGRREIKAHYLRTWFWPDLLSSLPFDLLCLPFMSLRSVLPWRLTRLIRFAKYDQYFAVWEQYSTRFPQLIRFSKLILGMMLILHWLACMWFACGYLFGFGSTVWLPPAEIVDAELSGQYVFAFWWATNIVTQVGGDPGLPSNTAERVMDLCIAFLSVFVVAVVIGNVNELVSELNANEGRLREKLQTLNHFMQTRRLPNDLQARIRTYYLTIWTRRGGVDDASIMSELPTTLRTEISLVMNQDILGKVPIFASSSSGFIHSLVGHLKLQTYGPKELIVREGDIGSEMYFVSRGQVNVIVGGKVVGSIGSGGFFGEIAVLQDMSRRTASIEAVNYCDLFVLTHEDMATLFKSFPAEKQIILHVADTRRAKDLLRRVLADDKLLAREKVGGWKDPQLVNLLLDLFKPIAMGAGADLKHDHGQGSTVASDDEGEDAEAAAAAARRASAGRELGMLEGDHGELIDLEHYGVVFSQHQPADAVYFIGKGAVDIFSSPPDSSPLTVDGSGGDEPEPAVLCRLTEGMFFGCISDEDYQVSALIPYEFHHNTIIFALTAADLPALHHYYDSLLDAKHKQRVKRALTTLLRRFRSEADYKRSLTPVPSPQSSREGSEGRLTGPPTPRKLRQLMRKVSRSARHSRGVSSVIGSALGLMNRVGEDDEDDDEADSNREEKETGPGTQRPKAAEEERKAKAALPPAVSSASASTSSLSRSVSDAAPAGAPTIITISTATETTPLMAAASPAVHYVTPSAAQASTSPPLASETSAVSASSHDSLFQATAAAPSHGGGAAASSPPPLPRSSFFLQRAETDGDTRRRSLTQLSSTLPLQEAGAEERRRTQSFSLDDNNAAAAGYSSAAFTSAAGGRVRASSHLPARLSPEPSGAAAGGASPSRRHSAAPFAFLTRLHESKAPAAAAACLSLSPSLAAAHLHQSASLAGVTSAPALRRQHHALAVQRRRRVKLRYVAAAALSLSSSAIVACRVGHCREWSRGWRRRRRRRRRRRWPGQRSAATERALCLP